MGWGKAESLVDHEDGGLEGHVGSLTPEVVGSGELMVWSWEGSGLSCALGSAF